MNHQTIPESADDSQKKLVGKIGFWAALISAVTYIAFDIAAICSMTGVLTSKYWTSIAFYTPSILIALSFVVLMVCIHYYAPEHLKVLSHIALVLAVIYATLNCFIYICQILVIAPSFLNGGFDQVALFEMAPDKPLYAVNALAYSIMGLSTLFAAFVFRGKGIENRIRTVLMIHGVVFPTIVGVLIWKPLFYISASVGLTYPLAAILLSLFFYQRQS